MRPLREFPMRLFRHCSLPIALALASGAMADQQSLGLFLQGQRIGTSVYRTEDDFLNSKAVKRNDSDTKMMLALEGTPVEMIMNSSTWSDPATGMPVRMTFDTESGGRSQKVVAQFIGGKAILDSDNGGQKEHRELDIPKGAPVVDDPLPDLMASGMKVKQEAFYVLDPTTISFVRNVAILEGPGHLTVNGKLVHAFVVLIEDPRANMTVYLDAKQDIIKIDGPLGIEMIPDAPGAAIPKDVPPTTPIDLASISSIPTTSPIEDADSADYLKIRFTGKDLTALPSDDHQTVKPSGGSWIVEVHPPQLAESPGLTIAEAGKEKPEWVKPGLDIPSDASQFQTLAQKLTSGKSGVRDAAMAVRRYVHSIMSPNAGIGVLRDATEVYRTHEGVCRDYAILTTTILRAAGIPARLASGLLYYEGSFYYHAWSEAWDGSRWIGVDSTVTPDQMSAVHIELSTGSVESAFTFTFLDRVKADVLSVRRA